MENRMRGYFALAILGIALGAPGLAAAQRAIPPGSYQQHCRNISINDIYLSAWCRGSRGSGQSTINVASCRGDIGVDSQGGLVCSGSGGGGSDYPQDRPYPDDRPRPPYDGGGRPPYDDGRRPPYGGGSGGGREPTATLYEGRGYRGRSMEVYGEMSNLNRTGFNDRVGSIRIGRRSGPWQICTDSKFRGRCTLIRGDLRDAREIGMDSAISSLRPY
jgi:hypothetical protein